MADKLGYTYVLASKRNGTLYIGVTSDPVRRIWQHKHDEIEGFTSRYGVKLLVHIEEHDSILGAIAREKQIKNWRRQWKVELIEKENPEWRDLYADLVRSITGMDPGSSPG